MVKPISPQDVVVLKKELMPDGVIEAFNETIACNMTASGVSEFTFEEVVGAIKKKMRLRDNNKIYDNNWLDVEDLYRKEGWKVSIDRPGYNESYKATFKFSKR